MIATPNAIAKSATPPIAERMCSDARGAPSPARYPGDPASRRAWQEHHERERRDERADRGELVVPLQEQVRAGEEPDEQHEPALSPKNSAPPYSLQPTPIAAAWTTNAAAST